MSEVSTIYTSFAVLSVDWLTMSLIVLDLLSLMDKVELMSS